MASASASALESEAGILEQLLRSEGRGLGFFPILVGLVGRQGAEAAPPDRIVLVNPLTQGMVVLQGDAELVSEILFEGGGRRGLPPATKASIEAMRTVEVGEAEQECLVCLDGLGGGEAEAVVKEMPCGHRFHGGCIEKWLGMHGSCPVCRFQMPVVEEAGPKKGDGEGEEERRRRRGRREVWITIAIGGRRRRRRPSDEERAGDDGDDAGEQD